MTDQLPPPSVDLAAIQQQLAVISQQIAIVNDRLADLDQERTVDANLVRVHIGFVDWIGLLVKIALASVPAMLIAGVLIFFAFSILGALGLTILGG